MRPNSKPVNAFAVHHSRSPRGLLVVTLLTDCVIGASASAQSKSLTWAWGNSPCGDMLNCETGCSACNLPSEEDASFFGTGATWIGVRPCPHPIVTGDNAVFTESWEMIPVPEKMVIISGMTLTSMELDSVIIQHRSFAGGPTMLRVSLKRDLNGVTNVVYEGPIMDAMSAISLRDLGCAEVAPGMVLGGFQLILQPFGSTDGSWLLDEVRVVAEPCAIDFTTGIPGLPDVYRSTAKQGQLFDLLGRPVPQQAAAGFYVDPVRWVIVY
ncbi:MAG TPA: hypothetical protein PK149_06410 [Flavobacteriales bacterium]|nr:hypothetical protein [Flavobacteriales bacterium]